MDQVIQLPQDMGYLPNELVQVKVVRVVGQENNTPEVNEQFDFDASYLDQNQSVYTNPVQSEPSIILPLQTQSSSIPPVQNVSNSVPKVSLPFDPSKQYFLQPGNLTNPVELFTIWSFDGQNTKQERFNSEIFQNGNVIVINPQKGVLRKNITDKSGDNGNEGVSADQYQEAIPTLMLVVPDELKTSGSADYQEGAGFGSERNEADHTAYNQNEDDKEDGEDEEEDDDDSDDSDDIPEDNTSNYNEYEEDEDIDDGTDDNEDSESDDSIPASKKAKLGAKAVTRREPKIIPKINSRPVAKRSKSRKISCGFCNESFTTDNARNQHWKDRHLWLSCSIHKKDHTYNRFMRQLSEGKCRISNIRKMDPKNKKYWQSATIFKDGLERAKLNEDAIMHGIKEKKKRRNRDDNTSRKVDKNKN